MSVYQIFRNWQCINEFRVPKYDWGSLTTWLYAFTLKNYMYNLALYTVITNK